MSRILVVDDALYMRKIIGGILESGGYKDIIEAADGESAIAMFEENNPDLVLLDITMPNINGIDVLRKIKSLKPGAKVVMCSAVEQERQMMRAISCGAAEYIIKPFKPDTMLRTIKKVLSQN